LAFLMVLRVGVPIVKVNGKSRQKGTKMTAMRVTRRGFLGSCVSVAAGAGLLGITRQGNAQDDMSAHWRRMRQDPVRKLVSGVPDLDAIRTLFPPLTGQPAFEPALIADNIRKLRPRPAVDTGHPFLYLTIKTGLAHIDATFAGDHPKYGVGTYAGDEHDGFPPTIIAALDALTSWA
jgi:hypothetical protein